MSESTNLKRKLTQKSCANGEVEMTPLDGIDDGVMEIPTRKRLSKKLSRQDSNTYRNFERQTSRTVPVLQCQMSHITVDGTRPASPVDFQLNGVIGGANDNITGRKQSLVSGLENEMDCVQTVDVRRIKRRYSIKPSSTVNTGFHDDERSNNSDILNDSHTSEVIKHLEVQEKKSFRISYEHIVWFIFFVLTVLCVVDRFTGDGDMVLHRKGKRPIPPVKIQSQHTGQAINTVIWAVTARILIVSQNMMFYSALWCFPNMLFEYLPSFVAVTGIRDIHMKIHRIVGVFMVGIPTLVHVLIIFLPPFVDKTKLTYHPPSEFNYSTQPGHLNWTRLWDPAAVDGWKFNDLHGVHLTSDEMYRFFLMIALFCVLFPLSRSNFLNKRSYSLAIGIHLFAGVWYAIDNIRKITHGLAHVFNTPVLLLWVLDRILSVVCYRRSSAEVVSKKVIGAHEYVEIRLKLNKNFKHGFGDIYYFLQRKGCLGSMSTERAHPFTSFSNHGKDVDTWNVGLIVNVLEDRSQWFPAWTRVCSNFHASEYDPVTLRSWGPYRSSVWELNRQLIEQSKFPCILIASGSGFGYLMDVLGFLAYQKQMEEGELIPSVDIHFTVRCEAFLAHFRGELNTMLDCIHEKRSAYITFNWYYTGERYSQPSEYDVGAVQESKIIENFGRIDFERIFFNAERSNVYFVGNPTLAEHMKTLCRKYQMQFIRDYTNAALPKSDKGAVVEYMKIMLKVIALTIVFAMLLSIYSKM